MSTLDCKCPMCGKHIHLEVECNMENPMLMVGAWCSRECFDIFEADQLLPKGKRSAYNDLDYSQRKDN